MGETPQVPFDERHIDEGTLRDQPTPAEIEMINVQNERRLIEAEKAVARHQERNDPPLKVTVNDPVKIEDDRPEKGGSAMVDEPFLPFEEFEDEDSISRPVRTGELLLSEKDGQLPPHGYPANPSWTESALEIGETPDKSAVRLEVYYAKNKRTYGLFLYREWAHKEKVLLTKEKQQMALLGQLVQDLDLPSYRQAEGKKGRFTFPLGEIVNDVIAGKVEAIQVETIEGARNSKNVAYDPLLFLFTDK